MSEEDNDAISALTDIIKNDGYDGISMYNFGTPNYVVFDSSQAKLTDLVTRDDDGEIIPPSERFNSSKKDIRYSLVKKTAYLPKNSLELGFSSHIMSLHAGENFDKSEYGLHTSYGDYEYLYDYFGDGEFGVLTKKPIDETEAIIEVLKNETDRSPNDVSKNGNVWETNRRRFEKIDSSDRPQRDSISNDGLDSGLLENNENNRPEEDGRESIRTFPTDEYYKTGADGTNRPRYEKRYSLKKAPTSLEKYLA